MHACDHKRHKTKYIIQSFTAYYDLILIFGLTISPTEIN